MRLQASKFSASAASAEYDDMAFFFAKSTDGYCFSLSRPVGSLQVEVSVRDQLTCKTATVSAKLMGAQLTVRLPPEVAAELDGNTEYEVGLSASPAQLAELHSALQTVFKGVGHYAAEL